MNKKDKPTIKVEKPASLESLPPPPPDEEKVVLEELPTKPPPSTGYRLPEGTRMEVVAIPGARIHLPKQS